MGGKLTTLPMRTFAVALLLIVAGCCNAPALALALLAAAAGVARPLV